MGTLLIHLTYSLRWLGYKVSVMLIKFRSADLYQRMANGELDLALGAKTRPWN